MPVDVLPADADLMRAYAAGDLRAFETLYTRHEKRLWRFVLRSVGNPATADELAQDVWLRVAQQADHYAPSASRADLPPARFGTWLFTIARNRVVDHLRASRPTHSLDGSANDDDDAPSLADTLAAPSGFGPVRRIETRQQAEQLLAAVQALPDDQREAFLLQAEAEMSVADIAAATGVPFETAKSRLRYARSALRRALETLA
ncbi:sigma-70 family RNA polymerase sigma factor [Ottowia flava]|uniref:Sigma-70 family RNA polymerase sigma factor n=1 Tax=Ottowia flava TaxID=2675430 RepID=A0ABW4KS98_9BURK|nr:sigma-70 family RNA polymerase sigma factor [Ottowia sp. GY511]